MVEAKETGTLPIKVRQFVAAAICSNTPRLSQSPCGHTLPVPASCKTHAVDKTPPKSPSNSAISLSRQCSPVNLWISQSPEDPPTVKRPLPKFVLESPTLANPVSPPKTPTNRSSQSSSSISSEVVRCERVLTSSDPRPHASSTQFSQSPPRPHRVTLETTQLPSPDIGEPPDYQSVRTPQLVHSVPPSRHSTGGDKSNVVIIDNIDHPVLYKHSRCIKAEVNRVRPDLDLNLAYSLAGGGVCLVLKSEEDTLAALNPWPHLSFGSVSISVHRPKSAGIRKVVRRYKCQRFGHIAKTCSFEQRCVRCGKSHESSDCPAAEARCVNCQDIDAVDCYHPSSHHHCPVFMRRHALLHSRVPQH